MGNWSIKDLYLKTESRSSNCPVSGFWFLKVQDATARNQKLTKPPSNHNSASVNAINEFTDSGGRQKIWQFLWFDNRDKRSRILFAHITISGSWNDIHIVVMMFVTVTGAIGLCYCLHNLSSRMLFQPTKTSWLIYAIETSPSGTFAAVAAAAQT